MRPWGVLALIAFLHVCGLYLFISGFFLTRFELADVSECGVLPFQDRELLGALQRLDPQFVPPSVPLSTSRNTSSQAASQPQLEPTDARCSQNGL